MHTEKVDVYVNVHKGLRSHITRFSYKTGSTDWNEMSEVKSLQADWKELLMLIQSHHNHEDRFIHPVLARISPGGHRNYEEEHHALMSVLNDLDTHFNSLMHDDGPKAKRAEIGLEFYRGLNLFYAEFLHHLNREEVEAERSLHSLCPPEDIMAMVGELIGSIPPDELILWIDLMSPAMNMPECAEFLGIMKAGAPPEAFKALAERVHMARGEADWQKLKTALGL
jgi:hypothetical protein